MPYGTITGYYWSFGDGQYSAESSPQHVYSGQGFYDVTCTVMSSLGEEFTAHHIVQVNLPFSPITGYYWDLNDGTSTESSPQLTYYSGGVKKISCNVSNLNETSWGYASVIVSYNFISQCIWTLNGQVISSGEELNYYDPMPGVKSVRAAVLNQDNESGISFCTYTVGLYHPHHLWEYGDGTSGTTPVISYEYTIPGNYTAVGYEYVPYIDSLSGIYLSGVFAISVSNPYDPSTQDHLKTKERDIGYLTRAVRETNINHIGRTFNETEYLRDQARPPIIKEKRKLDTVTIYVSTEKGSPPPALPPEPTAKAVPVLPQPKKLYKARTTSNKKGLSVRTYLDRNGNTISIYIKR